MRTRSLGRSGIEVGEIGIGTWGLAGDAYGPIEPGDERATLEAALDCGVTFIETASCYGANGAVEGAIGEVLRERGRDRAFVSVRLGVDSDHPGGIRKRFDYDGLMTLAQRSLARLGTDHADAFVLHNPQPRTLKQDDAIMALKTLQHSGRARLIGVSAGSQLVARLAINAGVDFLVLPYNLLFPKLLHSLASEIATAGVGVVVRSPFAYGVLADTWGADKKFPEGDHRNDRWTREELAKRVQQRDAARVLVHDHVHTLRAAALRYILANGLVSVVVPGARTPDQARQNASAVDDLPYLTDEDLGSIGEALRKADVAF